MQAVAGAVRPRAAPDRGGRGMVTVELAMGILTISVITVVLVSIIAVGVTHSAATSAAQQIARHAARGDAQAVKRAHDELPPRSTVRIEGEADGVAVTVESRPRVAVIGEVGLEVTAWSHWEPGEGP